MLKAVKLGLFTLCVLAPFGARAQTPANLIVLKGLAPVAALPKTSAGRAALAANFTVTGGIQTGAIRQPTLLPFAETATAGAERCFHHRRQYRRSRRGLGHNTRRRLSGARPLSRSRAFHQHLARRRRSHRLYQCDDRFGFQFRQIFFRQCDHRWKDAGLRRSRGDPEGQWRRHRCVRQELWPSCRQPRRRCLRRLASVPDRADNRADHRARLLQHARRQSSSTTAGRS